MIRSRVAVVTDEVRAEVADSMARIESLLERSIELRDGSILGIALQIAERITSAATEVCGLEFRYLTGRLSRALVDLGSDGVIR